VHGGLGHSSDRHRTIRQAAELRMRPFTYLGCQLVPFSGEPRRPAIIASSSSHSRVIRSASTGRQSRLPRRACSAMAA
jgi:hypothetical protein